jgi:hypothetical protein
MSNNHFTVRSLFAVTVCVALLLVLVLPAIRTAREEARRMQCAGRLKQLMLSFHNYESAYRVLPAGWGGPARTYTDLRPLYVAHSSEVPPLEPIGRYSAFVSVLPYIESNAPYQTIMSAPNGPVAPWEADVPWGMQYAIFRCPSDPTSFDLGSVAPLEKAIRTNFALSYGDTLMDVTDATTPFATRGVFQGRFTRRFNEVHDGLSNTVCLGEICTSSSKELARGKGTLSPLSDVVTQLNPFRVPNDCLLTVKQERYLRKFEPAVEHWRGRRWMDGAIAYTGFQTIAPPYGPNCSSGGAENDWGLYSLSSYHFGEIKGANIGFLDGAVVFLSARIDSGDPSLLAPPGNDKNNHPSQYGLWGAFGTIASTDNKIQVIE